MCMGVGVGGVKVCARVSGDVNPTTIYPQDGRSTPIYMNIYIHYIQKMIERSKHHTPTYKLSPAHQMP